MQTHAFFTQSLSKRTVVVVAVVLYVFFGNVVKRLETIYLVWCVCVQDGERSLGQGFLNTK